ncbi:mucin-5AC-like isoform X2 [Papaver somniferum]|uniref:mucin-5AC-like isoform X2 n=1 Tax=Papaver somniferum TaxID=3469 RepID=UPI000E704579|nr:mucin-5AC-like isoform X2 [Papaver somniferum]
MNNQRRVGISSPPSSNSRGSGGLQQGRTSNPITDENLDLFSRNRRIFNSYSSHESDSSTSEAAAAVSMKLGRLSVASVKLSRSGIDDLFNNNNNNNHDDGEVGKHDYDWLLTPPETPLVSSADANEPRSAAAGPRRTASVRSASTTKASRLSVAQPENNSRQTRSSSVTRSSISTTNYTSFSANKSSASILNTSSQSVTSISRPSTPGSRSSLPPPSARPSPPTSRPSTPGARSSRPSTPSRSRTITTTTPVAKPQTPQNSRPSTPTSTTQISTNTNPSTARSNSRPSTPTRRNAAPGPPQVRGRSASVGPPLTNNRSSSVASRGGSPAPVASRGSSPAPRTRTMHQPIVPPDFPLDTPPNLRTTMPDRPVSAGRSRPGTGLAASRKVEASGPVNPNPLRRQSASPVTTRGRLSEPSTRGRSQVNVNAMDNQKVSPSSDAGTRRPLKPATSTDSTGFGRTISKKSIDMALRHMDIRTGSTGGGRSLSGISVFPQSVRPGMAKGGVGLQRGTRVLDSYPPRSTNNNNVRTPGHSNAPSMSDNGSVSCLDMSQDGETEEIASRFTGKLSEPDVYDSSRYDMLLLKEDLTNTNWLQTMDDKSDLFDHQPFEPLPEPFDPL